jgi:hypothetical protein
MSTGKSELAAGLPDADPTARRRSATSEPSGFLYVSPRPLKIFTPQAPRSLAAASCARPCGGQSRAGGSPNWPDRRPGRCLANRCSRKSQTGRDAASHKKLGMLVEQPRPTARRGSRTRRSVCDPSRHPLRQLLGRAAELVPEVRVDIDHGKPGPRDVRAARSSASTAGRKFSSKSCRPSRPSSGGAILCASLSGGDSISRITKDEEHTGPNNVTIQSFPGIKRQAAW